VDFADEMHGMAVGTYFSILRTDDGGLTRKNISPGGQFAIIQAHLALQ
jgi:hypothetical protein